MRFYDCLDQVKADTNSVEIPEFCLHFKQYMWEMVVSCQARIVVEVL